VIDPLDEPAVDPLIAVERRFGKYRLTVLINPDNAHFAPETAVAYGVDKLVDDTPAADEYAPLASVAISRDDFLALLHLLNSHSRL
jgi:hypothetical protein